jgi:hypothetical protein
MEYCVRMDKFHFLSSVDLCDPKGLNKHLPAPKSIGLAPDSAISLVIFDAALRHDCRFSDRNMDFAPHSYRDHCRVETATHGDLMVKTASLLRKQMDAMDVKVRHVPIGEDIGNMTVETTVKQFAEAVASVVTDGAVMEEGEVGRMAVVVIACALPFHDARFAFLLSALAKSKNVLSVYMPGEGVQCRDVEYGLSTGEVVRMEESVSAHLMTGSMEEASGWLGEYKRREGMGRMTGADVAPSLSTTHPRRVKQVQSALLKQLSKFWAACEKEPREFRQVVASNGELQKTLMGGGRREGEASSSSSSTSSAMEVEGEERSEGRRRRVLIIGCDCGHSDGIVNTVCLCCSLS